MTRRLLEFTPWPEAAAQRYRDKGYWLDQPLTRGLNAQAALQPHGLAILCGRRTFTYGEVAERSDILAQHLAQAGHGHGETALVQLPNCAEFYIVFFALLKIGVAPVNALYSHKRSELSAYAEQIRPDLLIADRAHSLFTDDRFPEALSQLSPHLKTTLYLGDTARDHDLMAWMQGKPDRVIAIRPTPADQVAFFQLSGGSTGTPKLIPRTHNDYDYSIRASAEICQLSEQTRFLCALPAPHNFLMSSPGALGVFDAGGSVVIARSPDPQVCFPLIARHRVTMAALVPSAVALWIQQAQAGTPDLSSLKLLQVGGASFAETQARRVPEVLGCALQQVFGMAEGLVNYTRLDDDASVVFNTQGRPISPDDEIRIVDENGIEVPPGTAGMLATRGPYTFRGYFQSPVQNAKAFDKDGFYYSGDLVEQTPSGHLRVVGRIKDLINRGGEKIAAEEIENLLLRHPNVQQAALVAMQDSQMGEKSCAFIVGTDALRPAALRQHLMQLGVADYKLPDRFRFIERIPLTPVGKTDKSRLRDLLQAAARA